jgi:hypothetical protein
MIAVFVKFNGSGRRLTVRAEMANLADCAFSPSFCFGETFKKLQVIPF